MGRYLTPSAAGGTAAGSQFMRLVASNPAVPVPASAKFVRVSGCGGGGGGGNRTDIVSPAQGGGAAASAIGAILSVAGLATIAVTIGAAGLGAAPSTDSGGTNGGATIVTAGTHGITLPGGTGGTVGTNGQGGRGFSGLGSAGNREQSSGVDNDIPQAGFFCDGGESGVGGIGGVSQFGNGAVNPAFAANTAGADSTGFGGGGAGGHGTGGGGDGTPGFLILEFIDAA